MSSGAAASSSSGYDAAATAPAALSPAEAPVASDAAVAPVPAAAPVAVPAAPAMTLATAAPKEQNQGLQVFSGAQGEVVGFSISPAMQLYTMIDRLIAARRLVALPIAERYALAGQVAAVPDEHPRLVERLASHMATSMSEVSALNALYVLETCEELVPGFKDAIPADRLQKAAELSSHGRVQAAVLLGQKPEEWTEARDAKAKAQIVMMPTQEDLIDLGFEEDKGLVYDVGRGVGDATKFVGGSVLGGVGLVSDTLGITEGGEQTLADTAEDAVDLVGDGCNLVVDTLDDGLGGTAEDFHEKGVVGAVGDGIEDAADMIGDFVSDAVTGIAGGVHGLLNVIAGEGPARGAFTASGHETHKVAIVVAELFGEERSLGLRIESCVITKFTKPEAEKLGWKLNDCIVGVGARLVVNQADMLVAIGEGKESMKTAGTPLRFLVERMGPKPAGRKRGDLVFVGGRAAHVEEVDAQTGTMVVKFQDDDSKVRVRA